MNISSSFYFNRKVQFDIPCIFNNKITLQSGEEDLQEKINQLEKKINYLEKIVEILRIEKSEKVSPDL